MNASEFEDLKEIFEKDSWYENISVKQYNKLFDEFMTLDNQIELWNDIQKNLGNDNEIFHYTKDITEYGNKLLGELDLLQELMYPYYRVIDGEQKFYNELQVSAWITDDLYDWKYDTLFYIFNYCTPSQ